MNNRFSGMWPGCAPSFCKKLATVAQSHFSESCCPFPLASSMARKRKPRYHGWEYTWEELGGLRNGRMYFSFVREQHAFIVLWMHRVSQHPSHICTRCNRKQRWCRYFVLQLGGSERTWISWQSAEKDPATSSSYVLTKWAFVFLRLRPEIHILWHWTVNSL